MSSKSSSVKKLIGSGTFGVVYRISVDNTHSHAIKIYYSEYAILQEGKGLKIDHEAYQSDWNKIAHFTRNHSNMVPIQKALVNDYGPYEVNVTMEWMPHNLNILLETNPHIALDKWLSILCDVGSAIDFLHSRQPPLFHGNLHSTNIFVTVNLQAKVGDLMPLKLIQRYINAGKLRNYGPRAIQSLDIIPLGQSLDIFAFGLISCHVYTKKLPIPKEGVLNEVERYEEYLDLISNERFRELVIKCLYDDPKECPLISSVISTMMIIKKGALHA